jgi:hypothetical protein
MGRSFTPESLVALPALKSSAMLALLSALDSAAKAEPKLSAAIVESLAELRVASAGLQRAFFASGRSASPVDSRPADERVDRAWGAFASWLSGWSELEGEARAPAARALYAAVFSDGLQFLALKFREEWAESASKLALLNEPANKRVVLELGGAPFLTELAAAQQQYGLALGITKALPTSAESPELRAHFDRARAALRDYVLVVAGYGATRRKGARAAADRLLAPLESIDTSRDTTSETPAPTP